MKRGVSFEIPQQTADTLWQILSAIDIYKYFWVVIEDQTEVWDSRYENDFFRQRCYTGKNFAKCIQQDHHIVFLIIMVGIYYIHFERSGNTGGHSLHLNKHGGEGSHE